jgi:D-alanyl-D-alanine carboxypeptidase (penicillin-binding protein 5/6)
MSTSKNSGSEATRRVVPVAPKPDDVAAAQAAAILPHADALPVRVGVAVIGTIIVFGLIMAARSLNRRPQH